MGSPSINCITNKQNQQPSALIYFKTQSINCITNCSSATCSNPFNSDPYPSTYDLGYIPSVLIYFNSEVFISSEPYSVTRTSSVTWSNTFNSDDLLSQRGSMSSDPSSVTMTCSVTWSNPFNSDDLPHI